MEKLRARFTRNLVTLPRLPNNLNYKVKSVPFEDVVSEEVSEEDEEDEESQPLRVSARKKTAPVEEKKKKVVSTKAQGESIESKTTANNGKPLAACRCLPLS